MSKIHPAVLNIIDSLRDRLNDINGVALCLDGLTKYPEPGDGNEQFRYLGQQLSGHFHAAFLAAEELEQVMLHLSEAEAKHEGAA